MSEPGFIGLPGPDASGGSPRAKGRLPLDPLYAAQIAGVKFSSASGADAVP